MALRSRLTRCSLTAIVLACAGCGSSGKGTAASGGGGSSSSAAGSGGASGTTSASSSTGGATTSAGTGGQGASSSSASSGGAPDGGTGGSTSCTPDCTGKTCGDDGCHGTCGGCPPSQLCGSAADLRGVLEHDQHRRRREVPGDGHLLRASTAWRSTSDDSMQLAGLNRWGGDATELVQLEDRRLQRGRRLELRQLQGAASPPRRPTPSLTTSSDQFVHYNITRRPTR